jgi:N-methylhydantoinase B/oxoprolinase/acetone carboxylase alpha subunit
MLMDYTQHGPWPLFGGQPGRPGKVKVRRAGSDRFVSFSEAFGTKSASKFADVRLIRGDEVCIESCGGAGYGDPRQRDLELITRDIADGFVSKEAATALFGCTLVGPLAARKDGPDGLPI